MSVLVPYKDHLLTEPIDLTGLVNDLRNYQRGKEDPCSNARITTLKELMAEKNTWNLLEIHEHRARITNRLKQCLCASSDEMRKDIDRILSDEILTLKVSIVDLRVKMFFIFLKEEKDFEMMWRLAEETFENYDSVHDVLDERIMFYIGSWLHQQKDFLPCEEQEEEQS